MMMSIYQDLLAPASRRLLIVCRKVAASQDDIGRAFLDWDLADDWTNWPPLVDRFLQEHACAGFDGRDPAIPIFKLHFDCLHFGMTHPLANTVPAMTVDDARAFARNRGLPEQMAGTVLDLYHEMFSPTDPGSSGSGVPRPAQPPSEFVRILLLSTPARGDPLAEPYRLIVERIPGGSGLLYPSTRMLHVPLEDEWGEPRHAAREFLRSHWPMDCDVRWQVETQAGLPLPPGVPLQGYSAGAAWGLVLGKLLGADGLADLELGDVVISATLAPDGTLGLVNHPVKKLIAACGRAWPAALRAGFAVGQFPPDASALGLSVLIHDHDNHGQIFYDKIRPELHVLTAGRLDDFAKLCRSPAEKDRSFRAALPKEPDPPAHLVVRLDYLHDRVTRFLDTHESGYYELIALAGFGKTTFVKALIDEHRARQPTNPPVFFFASLRGTDRPRDIAVSFYRQLGWKYGLPNPSDPAGMKDDALAAALRERLMEASAELARRGAETGSAWREVLYLDAPDQMPEPALLLPGLLDKLPPRVFMVIATRPSRPWRSPHPTEGDAITYPDYAPGGDDPKSLSAYCAAVKHCLLAVNHRLKLPTVLIERICRADDPEDFPVFKTVSLYLDILLRDNADEAVLREALRTQPDKWRTPWESTLRDVILPLAEAAAMRRGVQEADFRPFLALCWAAREPLCQEDLEALKLWPEATGARMLDAAANLFRLPDRQLPKPRRPIAFNHAANRRVLGDWLTATERAQAHARLGLAGRDIWQRTGNPARFYAMRHSIQHLRAAGRWDDAAMLLLDLRFLKARMGLEATTPWPADDAMTVYDVLPDYAAAPELGQLTPLAAQCHALGNVLDRQAHFLSQNCRNAPALLTQCLYNELIWRLDADTVLAHQLSESAGTLHQPWIERRAPPAWQDDARCKRVLSHPAPVTAVASHDTQPLLAVGCADGSVCLWNAETGQRVTKFDHVHQGAVLALAFSPDDQNLIASGGEDGVARSWNWRSAHKPSDAALCNLKDWIRAVAFCPHRHLLACGGNDGMIRIFDIRHGHLLWEKPVHASWLMALTFSPDGRFMVSSGHDNMMHLWDVAGEDPRNTRVSTGHDVVHVLAFNPRNSAVLATGDVTGRIRLWNLADSPPTNVELPGHHGHLASLTFHAAGQFLAASYGNGQVRIWDTVRENAYTDVSHGPADDIRGTAFIAGASLMATGESNGAVRVWDIRQVDREEPPIVPSGWRHIAAAAFSPAGTFLATAERNGTIVLTRLPVGSGKDIILAGHERDVRSLAFSPDGSLMASGGRDSTVQLWNLATNQPIGPPLREHEEWVECLSFSPDGQWLASGGRNGFVRLWRVADGSRPHRDLWMHHVTVSTVSFSPDSKLLAAAGGDGIPSIWDVSSGTRTAIRFTGSTTPLKTAVFRPDGQGLIGGDAEGGLFSWSLRPGENVGRLMHRGTSPVTVLATLPGSPHFAAGMMDGTLQIWPTATATDAGPLALYACGNRVAALWFDPSPTGDFLMAELPPNSAPRVHVLRLHHSPHADTP